nr:uncharacterized protein LOC125421287 [Ziziphus jujuba var. spinosa]
MMSLQVWSNCSLARKQQRRSTSRTSKGMHEHYFSFNKGCLPAKLEHIVAAIEQSKDLKTYSLDKLFGYLKAHEKRMRRFSNQPVEQAFKSNCNITERNSATSTRGGSFRKGHGIQGRGRGGRNNYKQRNFPGNYKPYCIICKKPGHDVKTDKKILSEVKLGDGKPHEVNGKGVIAVNSKGGNSKLIHDVLYVPGLTSNLLSVGQLLRKNYSIIFDGEESKIINKNKNIMVAKIKMNQNNVFPLIMPHDEKLAFQSEKLDVILLAFKIWAFKL